MFYFFLHTRVLRHLFSRLVLLGCLCFLTAIYSVLLLMQLVFELPGFFCVELLFCRFCFP
jgi:hypothetical protein